VKTKTLNGVQNDILNCSEKHYF